MWLMMTVTISLYKELKTNNIQHQSQVYQRLFIFSLPNMWFVLMLLGYVPIICHILPDIL